MHFSTPSLAFAISLTLALYGCSTNPTTPIRMYSGEVLNKAKVVTLHPPSLDVAVLVLRVDGETPRSCWTNCMFMQPIEITAGKHKLESTNMNIPRGSTPNPLVANSIDEHVKKLTPLNDWVTPGGRPTLFSTPYKFEFDETFEGGKHYQLNIGTTTTSDNWLNNMVIWWQEIPQSSVPTKAGALP